MNIIGAPIQELETSSQRSAWLDLNQRFPAPEAGGLDQAFPHAGTDCQSAQQELNLRFRLGGAIGYRYNMGTRTDAELSKRFSGTVELIAP